MGRAPINNFRIDNRPIRAAYHQHDKYRPITQIDGLRPTHKELLMRKLWNAQLGPYYTVGDSLACSAVFLIVLAAMIWSL